MLRIYMSAKTQEEFQNRVIDSLESSKVKADGKLLSAVNEGFVNAKNHSHLTLSSESLIARLAKRLEASAVNGEDEKSGVSRIRPFSRMSDEIAEYLAIDSKESDAIYLRGEIIAKANGKQKAA